MSFTQYDWYLIGAILGLVAVSLLTRSGYLLFGSKLPISDSMRSALRYAPVAALAAIIVPEILPWSAAEAPSLDLHKLIAALVAVIAYLRTQSAIWLLVAGLVAYGICKFLF